MYTIIICTLFVVIIKTLVVRPLPLHQIIKIFPIIGTRRMFREKFPKKVICVENLYTKTRLSSCKRVKSNSCGMRDKSFVTSRCNTL